MRIFNGISLCMYNKMFYVKFCKKNICKHQIIKHANVKMSKLTFKVEDSWKTSKFDARKRNLNHQTFRRKDVNSKKSL